MENKLTKKDSLQSIIFLILGHYPRAHKKKFHNCPFNCTKCCNLQQTTYHY